MTDPVGAPTFAQMFSPTKSPFHALSLAALVCLFAIFRAPLADFGAGFAVVVLAGSFCLSPFYRPTYTDRVHGLSLMFGRSAGLIGSMIAIAILITSSVAAGSPDIPKLSADSAMFKLLRIGILVQALGMAALFFCKTHERGAETRRFNIIQFCLMQSTLLVFIVVMAVGQNDFGTSPLLDIARVGGWALKVSLEQIFTLVHLSSRSLIFALMFIWCVSGLVNGLLLIAAVEEGWVEDHGEGVSS